EGCERTARTSDREGAFAGGASVPGGEAPVRLHEGALSRAGEECRAVERAVRTVEPVDGAQAIVGDDGEGASASRKGRGFAGSSGLIWPICVHMRVFDPNKTRPTQQHHLDRRLVQTFPNSVASRQSARTRPRSRR